MLEKAYFIKFGHCGISCFCVIQRESFTEKDLVKNSNIEKCINYPQSV